MQPSSPVAGIDLTITVRFGDTDPYGVVYFASYFRYCHHGIEEFLKHHGLTPSEVFRNQAEGFGLPIVSAACDFLKPVWYGQQLRLTVSLSGIGEKSLTFDFRFCRQGEEEVVARGNATIVAIGADWRSRSIPQRVLMAVSKTNP
ncbi:MAG: acyl-CoA thioesterase [Syntrophobacteraceae bacterium]|jgi:acyl-CoA thioester hydrolase